MLTRLYHRMMGLAGHRYALGWLAIISFIESSVFPIPPDVLLIPMVLAEREKAWRFALVATLSSVAGGWLGYAIGYFLFQAVGQPIVDFYHLEAGFAAFQAKFNEYGAWIVLIKGMTPIPYKLVTIASGVAHLDPLVFTLASLAARAMRFFLVAGLLRSFGEPIRQFIEERLVLVTTVFAVGLVGGFLALKLL